MIKDTSAQNLLSLDRFMLFVPLPLFATLLLLIAIVRFVLSRDMRLRVHRYFAVLVGLYVIQSLLMVLRWGYDWDGIVLVAGLVAPILPVTAYLAFAALAQDVRARLFGLAVVVALNWLALVLIPSLADVVILATYLGFGGLLVVFALRGPDQAALAPLGSAREICIATGLTGLTLVASGLTDVFVIVDFIRTGGQNIGQVVTFVQSGFVLLMGAAASVGRVAEDVAPVTASVALAGDETEDTDIVSRLDHLFVSEGLHKDEELSLRRLARRIGLPERRVSNAINRKRGLSVSQFVNEARIKEACALLSGTQQTVLEVSLASGFATKSNFNREFARIMGTTPSRWRVEHRK